MTITLLTALLGLCTCLGLVAVAALELRVRRVDRESRRRIEQYEARLIVLEAVATGKADDRKAGLTLNSPAGVAARRSNRRVDRPSPLERTLITVPDLSVSDFPSPQASDELAQRYGSIWDRAEGGASPESIARETGQPIGQVELILGLRHPRASSSPAVS